MDGPQEAAREGPPGGGAAAPVSKWEWAVAAFGLALVAGTIGYSAYNALAAGAAVPVERVGTHATQGGYVVRFSARNHSGATAAELRVEGELRRGASVVEASGVTLGYLPSFSRRQGGLFFQEDPDEYELRLLPKGYAEP